MALFKTEFAKAPAAEQRNRVVSDFVFASIDAGKPLEAYQAVPDRVLAFQYLCEDLRDQNSSADLRRLIAAHAQSHPNDIRLKLQKAEMLVDDKQWAQALPLLEQGMKEAPQELRGMFRSSYVFVMHKMGRGLEALGAAPDKNDFLQLANLAVQDKQPAQLEALIAAYRKGAGDDADTFAYEARAKSMANKPAEALALLQRVWQKPNSQPRRRNDIINFVFDMHELGQGLAAYKAAPDKLAAFENLARRLAADKKPKELQELVDEHANHHAADPWLRYFRGELHLLQGAASAADQEFVAALAQAPARDKQMFRIGLYRARVASGKTVATYREFGADIGVFDSLANECFTSKNAKELAALLAAHRQSAPDAASQSMWDLELHWLKREYAAVQKILDEQKALFAQPRFRWKAEQYRVRCLIKQNKTQEALAEVERLTKKKRLDSLLLILAHAARGDAKQTLSAMEGLRPQPYFIASCYRDDDLGPILRGEAFAAFREKYPPPKGETGDE